MTQDMPRMIVHVSNGRVEQIIADEPLLAWLVDWDSINGEAGENLAVEIDPNYVQENFGTQFTGEEES